MFCLSVKSVGLNYKQVPWNRHVVNGGQEAIVRPLVKSANPSLATFLFGLGCHGFFDFVSLEKLPESIIRHDGFAEVETSRGFRRSLVSYA